MFPFCECLVLSPLASLVAGVSGVNATTHATVPASWTRKDRIAYLKLGQKRVNEHVQLYACVAIGSQLFVEMRRMRDSYDMEKSE